MADADVTLPARGATGSTLPIVRGRAAPSGATIQAINLVDTADTVLGVLGAPIRTDPTGTTDQPIIQHVIVDASNSSASNVNAGATWNSAGTGTSTLGVNSIQIVLKADQNCDVYVDQTGDGTNWDITDTLEFVASKGGNGWTVQAVGSKVRIRVKNTSYVNTTYFRLDTVLCPIVECLPRSLSPGGNLRTKIYGIEDEYGYEVENTAMGEMRVSQITRLVGANFEGATVDPNFWTSTVANSATIAQANAQIILIAGTNAAGSAKLASLRRARYVSANQNGFRAVVQLSATGTAQNTKKWGVAWGATMPTVTDGAWYQFDGTTFGIATSKAADTPDATVVANGSFNGEIGTTWAPSTDVLTYEIYWTNSQVIFTVGGKVLHRVSAVSATWAGTMNFHIYLENINAGSTTDTTLSCRVASIRRFGQMLTQPTSRYQAGTTAGLVLKYGAGNLHGISMTGIQNNSVITLYDNTAASGTILWASGTMAEKTEPASIPLFGIPFYTGLTLVISGANSNAMVAYE